MTIKMEHGMSELPEIKSEINPDDFGAHNNVVSVGQNSTTPQPQQQQQQQENQSANNCQWVGLISFGIFIVLFLKMS